MAYYSSPLGGYQPPLTQFPQQMGNYPPITQNAPTGQQDGHGWYYSPPPPQETEMDILKRILQTLEEIQKGMTKNAPHAE